MADRARVLTKGSRLVGRPCEVVITQMPAGQNAWSWCYTCAAAHIVNVPLFENGKGPWKLAGETANG